MINRWWGFQRLWEREQVGIFPSHHNKEPGAHSDNFWSRLFPKLQGVEPGKKELSALVIWSIHPKEVVCIREQWQKSFWNPPVLGKSQWHVVNSSQFLSTAVSGPLNIAEGGKKKYMPNCKIRSLKFQAQITSASALAHQSFYFLSHKPSMPQLPHIFPVSTPASHLWLVTSYLICGLSPSVPPESIYF